MRSQPSPRGPRDGSPVRPRSADCICSDHMGAEMSVIKDSGKRAILPPFDEEHEGLRETVHRFVASEIAPHVEEWEAAREFPRELYNRCAELGFLGLKFPEAYGGQGGTYLHEAVWA